MLLPMSMWYQSMVSIGDHRARTCFVGTTRMRYLQS